MSDSPMMWAARGNLVISLFGALLLTIFNVWLRNRKVKDSSLTWLTITLLSWAACNACKIRYVSINKDAIGQELTRLSYLFSPISSILLAKTSFRLLRIKELFKSDQKKLWSNIAVAFVLILSVIGWLINFPTSKPPKIGHILDATASLVSLMLICGAIAYSFNKYGNDMLAGFTIFSGTILIVEQFMKAVSEKPDGTEPTLEFITLVSLTMLFIALATAWSLSDMSRLRSVGTPTNVNVIAMYFDLRGSTKWSSDIVGGDLQYINDFINHLQIWALESTTRSKSGRPKLVKFLGDGYLFVWETSEEVSPMEQAAQITQLAHDMVKEYPHWAGKHPKLWKGVPSALGAGVDIGFAIRLTFENGSEDYIGPPLNIASKMQDLARPSGGVVVPAKLWRTFDAKLQQLIPNCGSVDPMSATQILVYASDEVQLPQATERKFS